MDTTKTFRISWMLGLMLCLNLSLRAQTIYQLSGNPELKVIGGSTLHDWEMVASSATGKAAISLNNQSIQDITKTKATGENKKHLQEYSICNTLR